jgi:hypothetical protein
MRHLTLDLFLKAGSDAETNQLQIMACLHSYRHEFSANRLYPALGELIGLATTIEEILRHHAGLQQQLPHELKSIDFAKRRLVFEAIEFDTPKFQRVIELMEWALPRIRSVIEEGARIYDFVDENLRVEEVGLLPMYRDEGYCFVPEHRACLLHLLRYEVSLFSSAQERFRTIKTRVLRSVRQHLVHASPESIKLQLVEEHQDLPNPATFHFETDLNFPFTETILPVAKRKLMARVFA